MLTPRDALLDLIGCNFDGKGWYGGNLLTALRKTDARLAAKKSGKLKTIYQQAYHAAYWKYIAIRRIGGDRSLKFRLGGTNWPTETAPASAQAWKETIQYLRDLQAELLQLVRRLPEEKLGAVKTLRLIHGVASHDVYHNGQIRVLLALLIRTSK